MIRETEYDGYGPPADQADDEPDEVAENMVTVCDHVLAPPDIPSINGDKGHTPDARVKPSPNGKAKRKRRERKGESAAVSSDSTAIPSVEFEDGRTEHANARRLVQMHWDTISYCATWKEWYLWDGKRHAPDDKNRIDLLAKDVAAEVWEQTSALAPKLELMDLQPVLAFAKATSSARGIESLIKLARSEQGVPIVPDQMDREPWLLNVANGTLDLKSGILRPHQRHPFLTKISPTPYLPDAACPTWEATLYRIMARSEALVKFIQRAFGYALTGATLEHVLFVLYGIGANGKTTILKAIMEVLGEDYAMQAVNDLLLAKRNESHPTERADLFGKRFVCTIETEAGKDLAEALLKQLTGADKVRARRMRQDFWQFEPTHTLFLCSNHKPVIKGTDLGIWRRIRLIPFVVTIPLDEQDRLLSEKLKAEYPGILAWLVRGCQEYQEIGLAEPDEVKVATSNYKNEMDVVGNFVAECCTINRLLKVKASQLFKAFSDWSEQQGERPLNQKQFGASIAARGFERSTNNGVWYGGITIRADESDAFEE